MGTVSESFIFRRFAALNAKNLLYLQAELVHLEDQLRECEIADNRCVDGNKSKYARDWFWLSRSGNDGCEDQWQTVLTVRKKLKEYSRGGFPLLSRLKRAMRSLADSEGKQMRPYCNRPYSSRSQNHMAVISVICKSGLRA